MATAAQKRLVQKRLAHIRTTNNVRFKWFQWTGFTGKTLWDWLQLLGVFAIPLVIAAATLLFSIQQARLADLQHLSDLKIADEQQQEATLQSYLDDMTTLLLDKKLGSPAVADQAASAEAAVVARSKTLLTLNRLPDPQRKARVLQFLYEAHLIGYISCPYGFLKCSNPVGPVVNLSEANLRGVDLRGTNLMGVDLSEVNLSGAHLDEANLSGASLRQANLSGANLRDANLSGTDLIDANLSGADLYNANLNAANLFISNLSKANLSKANLNGADLSEADLSGAYLSGASLYHGYFELPLTNLSGANLSDANLSDAKVTEEQLAKAKSLQGATMPDGTIHD